MNKNKGIIVYGYENFGKTILYNLAMKKIKLYDTSYIRIINGDPFVERFGNQFVNLESGIELSNDSVQLRIRENSSCIIVTNFELVLEGVVNRLMELEIPMIFCSENYTGYENDIFTEKVIDFVNKSDSPILYM